MTSLIDIEGRYAVAWYRLRLRELVRVPLPDKSWLKVRGKTSDNKQIGIFDDLDMEFNE